MANITQQNFITYLNSNVGSRNKTYYAQGGFPSVNAFYGTYDSTDTAHKTLCAAYGDFEDLSEITKNTPCSLIPQGFTVAVDIDGSVVEYQYKKAMPAGGYTANDLEKKFETKSDVKTEFSNYTKSASFWQDFSLNQDNDYISEDHIDDSDLQIEERPDGNSTKKFLKFADRSSDNGMGYVILRTDKTFAQQVTEDNTIYEIRYEFNLNNGTVTIPANCVLKFEGGSLSNGTINSNDIVIISKKKCFSNITFTGNCVKNYMSLRWWITEYPTSIYDYSIDNTAEIKDALASGCKRIVFPSDKYLYITETLTIIDDLDIYVDGDTLKHMNSVRLDSNGDVVITDNKQRDIPCIFTKDVITMIDYQIKSDIYKYQVYIGGITLLNIRPFEDLSEKDVPILKVSATRGTPIWGLTIDAKIASAEKQLNIDGFPWYYVSYTGIQVHGGSNSSNGYVAYVRLNGYILQTYNAYRFTSDGAPCTDYEIHGDTWCVQGFNSNQGTPVRIFGAHQPRYNYVNNTDTSYFAGNWLNIYGYVWDSDSSKAVSYNGNTYTIKTEALGIKILSSKGHLNSYDEVGMDHFPTQYVNYDVLKNREPKVRHFNMLNLGLDDSTFALQVVPVCDCTLDGTSIFELNNNGGTIKLYNHDNLFASDFIYNGYYTGAAHKTNANARITGLQGNVDHTLVYTVVYDTYAVKPECLVYRRQEPNFRSQNPRVSTVESLTVETDTVSSMDSSNKVTCVSDYTMEKAYYANAMTTIKLSGLGQYKRWVKLTISITFGFVNDSTDNQLALPIIGLISNHSGIIEKPISFRSNIGLPLIEDGTRVGAIFYTGNGLKIWNGNKFASPMGLTGNYIPTAYQYNRPTLDIYESGTVARFRDDVNRPYFGLWSGNRWIDADGYGLCYKKGTTDFRTQYANNRPKGLLRPGDEGFAYFDTDLNKMVYAKTITDASTSSVVNANIDWVEADGAAAGVNRSGTYANRPDPSSVYVGFKYFCTDKQTAEGATDGIEIIFKGVNSYGIGIWVDALGRAVS